MRENDLKDAVLVEESAEFLDLLASYSAGCHILEEVESDPASGKDLAEIQRWVAASRRQWRASLRRIGTAPALTEVGILAKCNAIQGYFGEHPAEDGAVMVLLNSLVRDIKRRVEGPDA